MHMHDLLASLDYYHLAVEGFLTISRRRPGDYKPREYRPAITEPEATNCFIINF